MFMVIFHRKMNGLPIIYIFNSFSYVYILKYTYKLNTYMFYVLEYYISLP